MARTFDAPFGDDFELPIRLTTTPRKRFPFRQDLSAILYEEDYVQRAEFFEPLPLDSPHPSIEDAWLVAESDPTTRSDGLFRWTRTFATIPATRTEWEMTTFNFPAYKTTAATASNLRENFTQSIVGKAVYSYVLTTDPSTDLVIASMFVPRDADSNQVDFVASDTSPTMDDYEIEVAAGAYLQANETEVSRWMGNLWQMRNVFVKAL